MCCKNFWKSIFSFVFVFGLFVINVFGQCKWEENQGKVGTGIASDNAYPSNIVVEDKPKIYPVGTKPLLITSKPRAYYTKEAEKNCVMGIVKIKVTFFANGTVGNFKVVDGLPFGLSEKAIEAAKLIKFEPAMKRGKVITVRKTVSYNFTIY